MSTALGVIRTQSMRWSAPSRFNDPFDVPREATPDFSLTDLRDACDREFIRLVEANDSTFHPRIRQIQSLLSVRPQHERSAVIREYLATQRVVDPPSSDAFDTLAGIWRTQVAQLRILCTTEARDSASMWDRYADHHRGVVFELRCTDETDSALLLARPIEYRNDPPKLPGVEWWAKAITLQPTVNIADIWGEYFYVKNTDWSPEREWRVITYVNDGVEGDYTDYPIALDEVQAIFAGYKVPANQISELKEALGGAHDHIPVYQASLDHASRQILFAPC
jgi:Protein of unknown function (DUF2971)